MTNEQLQATGEAFWPDASPETQLSLATKLHNAKQWMRERGVLAVECEGFIYTSGPKVLKTQMVPA